MYKSNRPLGQARGGGGVYSHPCNTPPAYGPANSYSLGNIPKETNSNTLQQLVVDSSQNVISKNSLSGGSECSHVYHTPPSTSSLARTSQEQIPQEHTYIYRTLVARMEKAEQERMKQHAELMEIIPRLINRIQVLKTEKQEVVTPYRGTVKD